MENVWVVWDTEDDEAPRIVGMFGNPALSKKCADLLEPKGMVQKIKIGTAKDVNPWWVVLKYEGDPLFDGTQMRYTATTEIGKLFNPNGYRAYVQAPSPEEAKNKAIKMIKKYEKGA